MERVTQPSDSLHIANGAAGGMLNLTASGLRAKCRVLHGRLMRFFLIVALLIWTAMHVYVFWRAMSVPVISRQVSRYLLAAVACFLWASYILAHILYHFRMGALTRILEVIGANWIGILFLLLVALLALDLVTLFGWLWPRFAPVLRGWALVAGAVLSVVALVQGHRAPVVANYEVRLAGLPVEMDGTVLALASDFHLGTQLGRIGLKRASGRYRLSVLT